MGQCCVKCKQEFRLKNIGFTGVHPARFVSFQWRCPPVLYLLYRIVLMIYADFWLIYTASANMDFGFEHKIQNDSNIQNSTSTNKTAFTLYAWPVYLTNWTYLFLCLYLTFHALFSGFYLFRSSIILTSAPHNHRQMFGELTTSPSLWENSYDIVLQSNESVILSHVLPYYFKLVWIIFNMASAASVMVTIVFFIFLWPGFHHNTIDLMNLQLHGINSVIIFLEHLVSAVPYRLLHYIYPFLYCLAYLIFSAIFYAAGNERPIYPGVLDWDQLGLTMVMVVLVGFVVLPILQLFFFIIYKIRINLFDIFTKPQDEGTNSDEGLYRTEHT